MSDVEYEGGGGRGGILGLNGWYNVNEGVEKSGRIDPR